ncbi:MAG: CPBP family intramembrane glutamic endopeptidase [Patescibacteria group bacterium]
MWQWAGDAKIIEKFKELKKLEVLFFSLFIFFYSLQYSWKYVSEYFFKIPEWFPQTINLFLPNLLVITFAILFISRSDILFTAFSFRLRSFKALTKIDKKIYFLFAISCIVSATVMLVFPDSWHKISWSIKTVANSISNKGDFMNEFFIIFREEVFYRLLLYYSLNRFFGRTFAFLGTVTAFSLMHHGYSFYYPFAVAPAGFLFSILCIATGSILSSLFLHLFFNIIVYIFAINFL